MDEKEQSKDAFKIPQINDQHIIPMETVEMDQPVNIEYDSVKNRDLSFKIQLKETFGECLSETSLHGLPKTMKKSYHAALRILWLIAFLTTTGYSIYLVIRLVQEYLNYPTIITTEYVHEIPTKYPAVSFCNMKNPDRSSVYSQALFAYLTAENISLNFPWTVYASPLYWTYTENYLWLAVITSLSSTLQKSIGYQIEDMLVSCIFNYLPCSSSDFSYFYHPEFGNCYTFNKEMPAKTISVPGVNYGLTLELYLGNPIVDTVNAKDGIIISIHNQTDAPFERMDVIKVPAGAETDLILNRNIIKRIPHPYGSCMNTDFSSELYEYIVNALNKSYSQEYCFSLCMQNQTKNKCGCVNLFLKMFANDNTSICLRDDEINCMTNLVNNFGNSSSNLVCQSACEFECNSIEFDIKSYNGRYPTTHYKSILQQWAQYNNKNVSYSDIPDSFAKVNIYYHSMQYKTIEEAQKISIIDLISYLGGVLGLCTGFSLLSAFEIVNVLFSIFNRTVKPIFIKGNRRVIPSSNSIIKNKIFSLDNFQLRNK